MPAVRRIQHTSIPMPPGGGDDARRFYGDVLGMREIAKPEGLRHLTVVWFQTGEGDEVHCFASETLGPNNPDQHLCLEVDDLAAYRARFAANDVPVEETEEIYNRPRFFVHDPFGNRVELTQILGEFR
jgi:catechol 2,3-dioxygenase-like lactoylglutathione lyase family enzyme